MSPKSKAPVSLRIRLKYPDVDTFVEKYAPNVSRGGVFIQSRAPQPIGTPLRFLLQLSDGTQLLEGEGRVVWIREYDASQPTQAHGMGVRFVTLTDPSQALLEQVIARKTAGTPARARPRETMTQEVRSLADDVGPTEAEEPLEHADEGHEPSLPEVEAVTGLEPSAEGEQRPKTGAFRIVLPAKLRDAAESSNGANQQCSRADQLLLALLEEASLAPAEVDDVLAAVLSSPIDVGEIEGLEQLMVPVEPLSLDPGDAREQLRQLLGAGEVPAVAPLTTRSPARREDARAPQDTPLAVSPLELESPAVDGPQTLPFDVEEAGSEPFDEQAVSGDELETSSLEATLDMPHSPEMEALLEEDRARRASDSFDDVEDLPTEQVRRERPIGRMETVEEPVEEALEEMMASALHDLDQQEEEVQQVEVPPGELDTPTDQSPAVGALDERPTADAEDYAHPGPPDPDAEAAPEPPFDDSLLQAASRVGGPRRSRGSGEFDFSEPQREAPLELDGENIIFASRDPQAGTAELTPAFPDEGVDGDPDLLPADVGWGGIETATELLDHGSDAVLQDMAAHARDGDRTLKGPPPTIDDEHGYDVTMADADDLALEPPGSLADVAYGGGSFEVGDTSAVEPWQDTSTDSTTVDDLSLPSDVATFAETDRDALGGRVAQMTPAEVLVPYEEIDTPQEFEEAATFNRRRDELPEVLPGDVRAGGGPDHDADGSDFQEDSEVYQALAGVRQARHERELERHPPLERAPQAPRVTEEPPSLSSLANAAAPAAAPAPDPVEDVNIIAEEHDAGEEGGSTKRKSGVFRRLFKRKDP